MYNQLVYLLDLCIFSYHLHSQTLIWPMDPYYEEIKEDDLPKGSRSRRNDFMQAVRARQWLPQGQHVGAGSYHGPGSCMNWANANNQNLDPIISRYDRLYPWRPSFTRPNREKESWIVYNTPVEITDPINQVYMVRYDNQGVAPWPYPQPPPQPPQQPTITVDIIHNQRPPLPARQQNYQAPPATDLLYCFEGGTGGTEQTHAPAWSMMGYVLAREEMISNQPVYDVFIVFRGSRSGSVRKTESKKIRGNPDWATDLGMLRKVEQDNVISQRGSVCRGFRSSLKTMLPTIMACLREIHNAKNPQNAPLRLPRTISVTGHSLGGALAGQFASALTLGGEWSPNAQNTRMPAQVRGWPWNAMQVTTYSSPVIGGNTFHQAFNNTLASHRIWLEGDPITQERWHYPVGTPLKIPSSAVISTENHDPYVIRRKLIPFLLSHGFPVSNVPGKVAGHSDEPWVRNKTFAEILLYFSNNSRINRTDFAACLRMGAASDFASEFETFLRIVDGPQHWTPKLISWIARIQPQQVGNLPPAWLDSIPIDYYETRFHRYLTMGLVLCAFSKGVQEGAVRNWYGTQGLPFTWQDIMNFK